MRRVAARMGRRWLAWALLAALPVAALAQPGQSVYLLQVDGLACPFCAYGVEKQLGRLPGVTSVDTDLGRGRVTVTLGAGGELDEARVRQAVTAAGFTLRGLQRDGR